MQTTTSQELGQVCFALDPEVEEILAGLTRSVKSFADGSEGVDANVADLVHAVAEFKHVGLGELLLSLEPPSNPMAIMFHVADVLGHANLTVGWQALSGVPAGVTANRIGIGDTDGDWAVALPGASGWVQMLPLADHSLTEQVCWFDGARLLAPVTGYSSIAVSGLLGFPHGRFMELAAPAGVAPQWRNLAPEVQHELVGLTESMLTGLLHGGLRRLVGAAYAYAKTRKSAGKPIAQHQAIALRLADLALYQQGLSLYLQCAVESGAWVDSSRRRPTNVDYIADTVARIAKDAVQVAAGHGYVEGLPFRRLFEQVRTLASALQAWNGVTTHERTGLHVQ